MFPPLHQWFSTGQGRCPSPWHTSPTGHWTCLETVLVVRLSTGGAGAPGIYWGDAAPHPTVPRTAPHSKERCSPNATGAEAEKPTQSPPGCLPLGPWTLHSLLQHCSSSPGPLPSVYPQAMSPIFKKKDKLHPTSPSSYSLSCSLSAAKPHLFAPKQLKAAVKIYSF